MPQVINPSVKLKQNVPSKEDAASQSVKTIIRLIDELVTVMDQEVEMIEHRKLAEHAELLKQKQRLTIDYRASLKSIALQPDFLRPLPEELKISAKNAAHKLAIASDRNAKILRGSMMAMQRLMQTIISMVKQEALPQKSYGQTGASKENKGTYSPTCKPVSVVRTA